MDSMTKAHTVSDLLKKADLQYITLLGVKGLLKDKAELSLGEIFLIWVTIRETRNQKTNLV